MRNNYSPGHNTDIDMNRILNNFIFHNINNNMLFIVKDNNSTVLISYNPKKNRISTDSEQILITSKGRKTDRIIKIMKWSEIVEITSSSVQ